MANNGEEPLYQKAELCKYLLDSLVSSSSGLEIRQSLIPGAGSALFTKTDIADGEEVFQSQPLVSVVLDTAESVCTYCFRDGDSRLHPSGRFRSKNDPAEVFPTCEQCRVAKYCSKKCCERANEAFHQYECKPFSADPEMPAKTRALCRLLLQRKHGLLPDQMWHILQRMESHYEARKSRSGAKGIHELATAAKAMTRSCESLESISKIYCILLTNNICIREPGQSKVLGTALDIVMSMMNNSCDPNVVTVFQGNQLCVRSLRPIHAGEELLQCYTDETCDVLLRRKKLLEQFHFICECHRCVRECSAHEQWTGGETAHIEKIQKTQEEVTNLINTSLLEFTKSPSPTAVSELESRAISLMSAAVSTPSSSPWPQGLDPLPTLYKRLGNMSSMLSQPLPALKYNVKGCAYTQVQRGPEWASDMLDLIKLLVPVASHARARASAQTGDEFPMKAAELWIVFVGYLHMLVGIARKLYGEDAVYTRAVARWFEELLEGVNPALLATAGFRRKLKAAHGRLLGWAGVDDVEPVGAAWVLW